MEDEPIDFVREFLRRMITDLSLPFIDVEVMGLTKEELIQVCIQRLENFGNKDISIIDFIAELQYEKDMELEMEKELRDKND